MFLAELELMLRTLGQPVVGQLQLGEIDLLAFGCLCAQQRMQMLGEDAELLQLAVLVADDLRQKFVGTDEAGEILLEEVQRVARLAGFLQLLGEAPGAGLVAGALGLMLFGFQRLDLGVDTL